APVANLADTKVFVQGRQFLQTAGKEKAYIFIVVNRFDQIRRKDRCRRDILDQIREISPLTFEDADHLVHFVAAKETLKDQPDGGSVATFASLESNLRSFILEKRSRSKLAPAKIYLGNLMTDVAALCQYNHHVADAYSRSITDKLTVDAPAFEKMLRIKEQFLDNIDRIINETGDKAERFSRNALQTFFDDIDQCNDDVPWRGVLGIWQYARDLRNTIYRQAAIRLRKCEEFARQSALACVKNFEELAASCMDKPPKIDLDVVATVFEDGSQEAGRAAAAAIFVPLELNDFFAYTDKVAVVREYVPGLAMILGGLIGYQAVVKTFTRGGVGLMRGRVAFAGVAIAGVGLFLYTFSDMKTVIDRQVMGKMKAHLRAAGLVDGNVDRISRGTRRVLRLAIWEFQSQFQRILNESEQQRREQNELRMRAEVTKDSFRALGTRASTLRRMLDDVDV
ncbi:mitofusin, partial [Cladochytrium tenue]